MKVFRAVAVELQSPVWTIFSLSVCSRWSQAGSVMTENKKMTLLLGMINGARVVFAITTASSTRLLSPISTGEHPIKSSPEIQSRSRLSPRCRPEYEAWLLTGCDQAILCV